MLGTRITPLLGIICGIALGAYLTSPLVAALSDGIQEGDLLIAEQVKASLISAAFFLASLMVVLTVGTFVIVYVHELGHLLVGSAFGFEPLYFMAAHLARAWLSPVGRTGGRWTALTNRFGHPSAALP